LGFDGSEVAVKSGVFGHLVKLSGLAIVVSFALAMRQNPARADTTVSGATSASPASSSSSTSGKTTELAQASGTSSEEATIEQLRGEIEAERARTAILEKRLDEVERQQHETLPGGFHGTAGRAKEVTPGAAPAMPIEADIYDKGFFLRSHHQKFSLYINGLAQTRYTFFKPNSISQFGANNPAVSNFDLFLGRLAVSGNVFEPDLKYFFQIQGSTAGNSNTISLLDWFTSKTFNPYLTIQAGRSWTFYSYEYYDNPGTYLFADLSTAEYAFLLQRAIGLQISGQAGKLGYGAEVANSVPALDAAGQENLHGQMAYIGNLHYDILEPYGWEETDPTQEGAAKPELSLWASGMYNPVEYNSTFQNEVSGDKTYGSTASILFRYRYLSFQGTGYYRRTIQHLSLPSYDSWGFGEQAGYYLVPAQWEIAERITGVWWGAGEIPSTGGSENTWFSGPGDFSYHSVTEYSVGLNYYLYGHNAKIQAAYSYLAGQSFNDAGFGANRVWLQSQIMF
jgi:hypothetical protein